MNSRARPSAGRLNSLEVCRKTPPDLALSIEKRGVGGRVNVGAAGVYLLSHTRVFVAPWKSCKLTAPHQNINDVLTICVQPQQPIFV
jgi:hypothetical protein